MSVQPPIGGDSSPDEGDGIRIHRRLDAGGGWQRRLSFLVVLLALASIIIWQWRGGETTHPAAEPPSAASAAAIEPDERDVAPQVKAAPYLQINSRPASVAQRSEPAGIEDPVARFDPDDLANYVAPDDPEPTMKEVIDALHDEGIHTGLGAFNPPGTSPPLLGIAVPADFVLPEGYVRHHQVTDAGEPIEPILMFSPDFDFVDESGQLIALPEDMVVPPEMAPPGLPIRPVQIPTPP